MPGLSKPVGPLAGDARPRQPGRRETWRRGGGAVTTKAPPSPPSRCSYWLLLSPPPPAPSPLGRGAPSLRFRERRPVPVLRLVHSAVSQVRKVLPVPAQVGPGKFRLLAPAQGRRLKERLNQPHRRRSVTSLPAYSRPLPAGGERPEPQLARDLRPE